MELYPNIFFRLKGPNIGGNFFIKVLQAKILLKAFSEFQFLLCDGMSHEPLEPPKYCFIRAPKNISTELIPSVKSLHHKLVVGISATMCHSAEKIPAKEGCQSKRVSKKQQSYPSRVLKQAPLDAISTAQGSQEVPRGAQQGQHSQELIGAITKHSSRL